MSGLLVKDIQIVLKQKLLLLLAVVFGVGKIDFGVKLLGNILVVSELGPVVGGDGKNMAFKGAEHLHHKTGDSLGVLSFRGPGHKHFLGGALDESDNGPLAILADDGVHLPVAEAGSGVHSSGPFVDAHPILDGDGRAYLAPPMFEMVRQVGVQIAAPLFVSPDNVVEPLDGDARLSCAPPGANNSFWRPMPLKELLDF